MNQRIYINSYLQGENGDDTEFTINLNQTYNAKGLKLSCFVMDNLLTPFYQSARQDFRQLGIIVGGVTYQVTIDQNLESFDQIVEFFNAQGLPVKLVRIAVLQSYLNVLSFKAQNLSNVDQTCIMVGAAWEKLGFDVSGAQAIVHTSKRAFDFSQPPCVLIEMNLEKPFDTHSFVVPNTSSFGSKLIYQAEGHDNQQLIVFAQQKSFSQLKIRLLNSDLQKLQTARQLNAAMNQNKIECLFVIDVI